MVEDPLSEKVLFGEFTANTTILVEVDPDDPEHLAFSKVEAPDQAPVALAGSEG
jgi:hypothetical protein